MNLSNLKGILEAREARAAKQHELLLRGGVLISYGLNIPGPVKTAALFETVFKIGLHKIEQAIRENDLSSVYRETGKNAAGFFAYILLDGDADGETVKRLMVRIEETDACGRLLDIDVLVRGEVPVKIGRLQVGLKERNCLVCGSPAFVCVRAARHGVPEVMMKAIDRILSSKEVKKEVFSAGEEGDGGFPETVALEALRAILYEVITTPKPGLVDTENNGAHKDMDITSFFDSAVAIAPYFRDCVSKGQQLSGTAPEEILPYLRPLGIRAEQEMYAATGGVNTHKGAIFTLGILCAAAGYRSARGLDLDADEILNIAGRISSSMENGSRGIRTEAMNGYPSLRAALKMIKTGNPNAAGNLNIAGVKTLLMLMSLVDDSNAVRRRGEEAAEGLRLKASSILSESGGEEEMLLRTAQLDRELILENLSPGGSADLLAAAYFLSALK